MNNRELEDDNRHRIVLSGAAGRGWYGDPEICGKRRLESGLGRVRCRCDEVEVYVREEAGIDRLPRLAPPKIDAEGI